MSMGGIYDVTLRGSARARGTVGSRADPASRCADGPAGQLVPTDRIAAGR